MKTFWLINEYATTPETGMGGRLYYFSRELAKLGHRVYLIASASHHLLRRRPIVNASYQLEPIEGFTMVWVRMPEYTAVHSVNRVLNWFLFALRLRGLGRSALPKPDAVLYSSPSPFGFLGARSVARHWGALLVFDVRDLWPLTLIEIGGYSPRHPLIYWMQRVEDVAYRDADIVCCNLSNAQEHMVGRGLTPKKYRYIPNGICRDEVGLNTPLNNVVRRQLPHRKFVVGYAGTIGISNALDTLLDAAVILRSDERVAFVLVGDGEEKERLVRRSEAEALTNVIFIESVPKGEIQSLLSTFDACFKGSKKSPLYRYGIGANKLPEYLYAARPILHAYSGAADPVREHDAGIAVEAENPEALAKAILRLCQMRKIERLRLGDNGRKAALEHYEYGRLAARLVDILFE